MHKLVIIIFLFMIACNSDNSTNPENNTNNNSGWTQTSFPSGLYGDWYNSSGAWIFGITDSTTIRTGNQFYELVVTYTKDNVYKAITTLSGEYYTFFFKDITSTSMSVTGRSGPYSTQSAAENATPGTYDSYTNWLETSFPSELYGNWYNSSGTWIFGITDSTIRTGNQFYELVVTYTKDNVYKAITTLSGEYYTFFFKDITSTSMSATGRSGPYSTQSAAENATPGTYDSYTNWLETSFPSELYGNWYNSSGTWIFGITASTIRTGNLFHELVITYKKDNVYKAITTLSGEYYTFFFKDITSTSMSATGRSGPYSTQSEAENASPGTYYSYTKG